MSKSRIDLINKFKKTFSAVTRTGGVSWRQSAAIDAGSECVDVQRTRFNEPDASWMDLVDDPSWLPKETDSLFCFLDEKSYLYYLIAAIVKSLNTGDASGVLNELRLDSNLKRTVADSLTDDQRRLIREYLEYLLTTTTGSFDRNEILDIAISHWN